MHHCNSKSGDKELRSEFGKGGFGSPEVLIDEVRRIEYIQYLF